MLHTNNFSSTWKLSFLQFKIWFTYHFQLWIFNRSYQNKRKTQKLWTTETKLSLSPKWQSKKTNYSTTRISHFEWWCAITRKYTYKYIKPLTPIQPIASQPLGDCEKSYYYAVAKKGYSYNELLFIISLFHILFQFLQKEIAKK